MERLEQFKDKSGNEEARKIYDEIRTSQKQMRSLKSDLLDLDTLLLEFEKAYRRCEARMEDRPKSPFFTTKKKNALKTWHEAISLSFKANEKMASELAEGEVFLAGKTSAKIEEDLNLIDSRIQAAEAAAAAPPLPEKEGGKTTEPEAPENTEVEKPTPEKNPAEKSPAGAKEAAPPTAEAEEEAGDPGGGVLLGIIWGIGGALAGAGGLLLYLRKKHYF